MTISLDKPKVLETSIWQTATWQDYEKLRDDPMAERIQLFFNRNLLWVENMGWEGILHSEVRELLSAILVLWLMQQPELKSRILGSCLMEKPGKQAAAPDILIYLGEDLPQYQPGESRKINLEQQRVPNLIIEISDTTLDSDLDEKKHLYLELEIREYWVIDAKGGQVFIFVLQDEKYLKTQNSEMIAGFPINLLTQALVQLRTGFNITAAAWFNQQITLIQSTKGQSNT